MSDYDPFIRGPFTVQARTTEAHDTSRDRVFKCEIWNPSAAGTHPLVVYSHFSGGNSPGARFPCGHIFRHGYVVAARGHSGTVVSGLAARPGMSRGEPATRGAGWRAGPVPPVRVA